jgi:hypothetical protein
MYTVPHVQMYTMNLLSTKSINLSTVHWAEGMSWRKFGRYTKYANNIYIVEAEKKEKKEKKERKAMGKKKDEKQRKKQREPVFKKERVTKKRIRREFFFNLGRKNSINWKKEKS